MRAIDGTLQAKLDGGATSLCRCWAIQRRDGTEQGFTDHDRTLSFDGVTFEANSGLFGSAVKSATGLSVDNSEVSGALDSDGLSEADLMAGRYDGATVRQWVVDWTDVSLRVQVFTGTIGEVRREDGAFQAEIRSHAENLNQTIGRSYLRQCDCRLGDKRCRVDVNQPGLFAITTVGAVDDQATIRVDTLGGFPARWFTGGLLEWLTGDNAGLTTWIKEDRGPVDDRMFSLWQPAEGAILPGQQFRVVAGCDKTLETCHAKFDNAINFRGFPHMPGEDYVAAYPSSNQRHTGKSLRR